MCRAHFTSCVLAQLALRASQRLEFGREFVIEKKDELTEMFTGLIADLGSVKSIERDADGATLEISTRLASELLEGDSVAVSGVCLTATAVHDGGFHAQAMAETLRRSTLEGMGA
ncbi:MAG: hypothetical protein WAN93_02760, partial [Solirubrobacteraceae bacterium]